MEHGNIEMHWCGAESRDVSCLTGNYNIVYLTRLNDTNDSTVCKPIQ